MKLRKIKLKVLILQGAVYRVILIVSQTLFTWIIIGEFSLALGLSLAWNFVNILIYYLYHYICARLFKLGEDK